MLKKNFKKSCIKRLVKRSCMLTRRNSNKLYFHLLAFILFMKKSRLKRKKNKTTPMYKKNPNSSEKLFGRVSGETAKPDTLIYGGKQFNLLTEVEYIQKKKIILRKICAHV